MDTSLKPPLDSTQADATPTLLSASSDLQSQPQTPAPDSAAILIQANDLKLASRLWTDGYRALSQKLFYKKGVENLRQWIEFVYQKAEPQLSDAILACDPKGAVKRAAMRHVASILIVNGKPFDPVAYAARQEQGFVDQREGPVPTEASIELRGSWTAVSKMIWAAGHEAARKRKTTSAKQLVAMDALYPIIARQLDNVSTMLANSVITAVIMINVIASATINSIRVKPRAARGTGLDFMADNLCQAGAGYHATWAATIEHLS